MVKLYATKVQSGSKNPRFSCFKKEFMNIEPAFLLNFLFFINLSDPGQEAFFNSTVFTK